MTLAYLHPIFGALVVALLFYAGSLGLRARTDRRRAPELLARHVRLTRIMYPLMLASWVSGLASTWLLRPDLQLWPTNHFHVGVALVVVLTAAWITSRWMHRDEIRSVHPWFGAAAMLLAAAQVFFGLQITP
jgi:uncharacterized membrane protein